MPSYADMLFGKIAVQNRLITQEQLEESIKLQEELRQKGIELTLGEVLLKKKFMTLKVLMKYI